MTKKPSSLGLARGLLPPKLEVTSSNAKNLINFIVAFREGK